LVELLVVVGIIAMLVAILAPALGHAVELARRAKCAVNLNGIGGGLALYESERKQYPFISTNGAGWGVAIGSNRSVDPGNGGAAGRSPVACLYELVRIKTAPVGMFVCPSSREKSRRESGGYWDFADGKVISYAVMNPYGPMPRLGSSAGPDVPILADSSPFFDAETGLRNDVDIVDLASATDEEAREGNSLSHAQAGQNVTLVGGATVWEIRADVGSDLDNIYTRADGGQPTDREGSIPAATGDASAESQGPAGADDSYLVQ